ncbi:hypothetical protein CMQ_2057 [Grosmannia clavigera kw1407]|uniref:Mediator of RNA polymerase II transcription subunit 9 n=1 Tax=Grosmannia clavigera (strain kw1407 / UAMH 11150) TaxID=655863 RepID=F0XNA8_GROCL|nr:uncharacterized protein CMQ_2057 [Grosmannia clavigera kw1407]EFX00976.1 hypothetical protein CMQ_2057 [Grosmannia clavigera kw1407]
MMPLPLPKTFSPDDLEATAELAAIHARDQIRALPDISRTVAEQEAEMQALEARLQKQKAVLGRLREEGARFAQGEQGQQPKLQDGTDSMEM